jgi:hypothetical protein
MRGNRTPTFSCGARSAFKLSGKKLLEKHAIAPSAARLSYLPTHREPEYRSAYDRRRNTAEESKGDKPKNELRRKWIIRLSEPNEQPEQNDKPYCNPDYQPTQQKPQKAGKAKPAEQQQQRYSEHQLCQIADDHEKHYDREHSHKVSLIKMQEYDAKGEKVERACKRTIEKRNDNSTSLHRKADNAGDQPRARAAEDKMHADCASAASPLLYARHRIPPSATWPRAFAYNIPAPRIIWVSAQVMAMPPATTICQHHKRKA